MTSLQQLPVLTLLSLEDNDQRSLSQVRHPVSNPNHPIRIKQIACSEALKVLRDDAARGCAQLDVLLPLVNLTLMFVSNPVMNVKWFAFRFPALKIHRPPTPFDAGLAAAASGAHTPILLQEVRSSSWLKLSAKDPLRIRHFSTGRAALHPRRLQPCPSHTTHPTHQLVFRLGGSTIWSPHPASRSNARPNPTALRQVLNRLPLSVDERQQGGRLFLPLTLALQRSSSLWPPPCLGDGSLPAPTFGLFLTNLLPNDESDMQAA